MIKCNWYIGLHYSTVPWNKRLEWPYTESLKLYLSGWGGALSFEGGTGMYRRHDPHFQANQHSLAYQFTINAPLMWPPFSIFRKFCIFSLVFSQNFQLLRCKSPLPRPYFWKPVWHIPTKKSWVPPSPRDTVPIPAINHVIFSKMS